MAKEFDNIKMWESIIKYVPVSWIKITIKKALRVQGFEWDGEHIVPIEQDPCVDCKYAKEGCALCCKRFHDYKNVYHPVEKREPTIPEIVDEHWDGLVDLAPEKNNMTEFEKVLSEMLDEYGQDPDRMKDSIIAKYGNEIRKQIASEIDTDILQDKYWITELIKNQKHDDTILRDGVYIVYKDGRYALFDDHLSDTEGILGVGICWHGHTWRIGTDFGDTPWSKATDKELDAISYGIVEEGEALFDWDYMKARQELGSLWKHLPLADDESLPTAPMVLVQEHLAKHGRLNDALRFCGIPEYETDTRRWFAQRCYADNARVFYGTNGALFNLYVDNSIRSQAVALWSPNI